MRRLLPTFQEEVDLKDLEHPGDHVVPAERPWVMANMVMSIDGAYAVQGRSGGLGTPGDRRVFAHLRQGADAILVAAGTARQENYRRPHMAPEVVDRRRQRGQTDHPRLVLISRSLALPDDLPLLDGEGPTPLVMHPAAADPTKLPDGVEARGVGDATIDLREAMQVLRSAGVRRLLCEGGPSLLGQLHHADLLDELFLTLSPTIVGGEHTGILGHSEALTRRAELYRLMEEDGALFLTYRRAS